MLFFFVIYFIILKRFFIWFFSSQAEDNFELKKTYIQAPIFKLNLNDTTEGQLRNMIFSYKDKILNAITTFDNKYHFKYITSIIPKLLFYWIDCL